jgi:hypothetical protein
MEGNQNRCNALSRSTAKIMEENNAAKEQKERRRIGEGKRIREGK